MPNGSIDTDVLSAGFARLLAAGHFRRCASQYFDYLLYSQDCIKVSKWIQFLV
jgi:hypothetical protein